jgi:hypothetical protein
MANKSADDCWLRFLDQEERDRFAQQATLCSLYVVTFKCDWCGFDVWRRGTTAAEVKAQKDDGFCYVCAPRARFRLRFFWLKLMVSLCTGGADTDTDADADTDADTHTAARALMRALLHATEMRMRIIGQDVPDDHFKSVPRRYLSQYGGMVTQML